MEKCPHLHLALQRLQDIASQSLSVAITILPRQGKVSTFLSVTLATLNMVCSKCHWLANFQLTLVLPSVAYLAALGVKLLSGGLHLHVTSMAFG